MPRIVDGDNLLGRWPGRKRSAGERRRLTHQIQRLARRRGTRIVVVFDGTPPPGATSGADVHYAGRTSDADTVIIELLKDVDDVAGWSVVTDDRPLADQCRYLGARHERCGAFRQRLAENPDAEKPEREDDLDYWLRVFDEPD